MDTITTIPDLLTFCGSARPVMVALMPSEQRLIAAAPELLEALQSLLNRQPQLCMDENHRYDHYVAWEEEQEAARTAIRKAQP